MKYFSDADVRRLRDQLRDSDGSPAAIPVYLRLLKMLSSVAAQLRQGVATGDGEETA